jgi:small subunit ribosomal protein S12
MPTVCQLVKKSREPVKKRKNNAMMCGKPQRKCTVVKVYTVTPKKPNSAMRKVAKVRFSDGRYTIAYVRGEDHKLTVHSVVCIMGGRVPDLPGVRYKIILNNIATKQKQRSRSKYSQKKPTKAKQVKK